MTQNPEEHKTQTTDPMDQAPDTPMQDLSESYLNDAFNQAFRVLKIIMAIVVIWFLASGFFRVEQDEQALVLLFGRVQGAPGQRVLGPGPHFALPSPINEIVRIPTEKIHLLSIDNFWYFQPDQQSTRVPPDLDPIRDGYALTRNEPIPGLDTSDYNIVHAKWEMSYRIDNLESFFRNIEVRPLEPGEIFEDALADSVDPLLRSIASDAIVSTMVYYTIDEAIVSAPDISSSIRRRTQAKLDNIQSGITVTEVRVIGRIVWPRQVDDAFQNSIRAKQGKARAILEARGYADTILNEAGGAQADRILEQLKGLQEGGTPAQRKVLLDSLSGQAQEIISNARAYRTRVVENARANADYLEQLLPEYKKRPTLVIDRIYQESMEQILAGVDEIVIVEPGRGKKSRQLRVLINRNPNIRKTLTQDGENTEQ